MVSRISASEERLATPEELARVDRTLRFDGYFGVPKSWEFSEAEGALMLETALLGADPFLQGPLSDELDGVVAAMNSFGEQQEAGRFRVRLWCPDCYVEDPDGCYDGGTEVLSVGRFKQLADDEWATDELFEELVLGSVKVAQDAGWLATHDSLDHFQIEDAQTGEPVYRSDHG